MTQRKEVIEQDLAALEAEMEGYIRVRRLLTIAEEKVPGKIGRKNKRLMKHIRLSREELEDRMSDLRARAEEKEELLDDGK